MKTFLRMLGLAYKLLPVLILLGKFILIVMQIVSGATNPDYARGPLGAAVRVNPGFPGRDIWRPFWGVCGVCLALLGVGG